MQFGADMIHVVFRQFVVEGQGDGSGSQGFADREITRLVSVLLDEIRLQVDGGEIVAAPDAALPQLDQNFVAGLGRVFVAEPNHKHANTATYTRDRIAAGKSATGWSTLAELLTGDGQAVVTRVRKWLRCDSAEADRMLADHLEDTSVGTPSRFNCTDAGNGRRLASRHGHKIRYCHSLGKWLVWTGARWQEDGSCAVDRLAKETALSILEEARNASDPDDRKKEKNVPGE